MLEIPGRRFRQRGLARTWTDKFLSACGCAEGRCDGLITEATFVLHKIRRTRAPVCLEFSASRQCRAFDRRDQGLISIGARTVRSWPASNIWTSVTSRPSVMHQAKRAGPPEDGAACGHRR